MKKSEKSWLIFASVLILVGLSLGITVMSIYDWDFSKLSTMEYATNTYEIHEKFENISVETDDADILFVPASDGICRVECFDAKKVNYSVTAVNNTLMIQNSYDIVTWKDFAIQGKMPKVTVYLPENDYKDLRIVGSTGDVEIPKDFRFASMDIHISTGNVRCSASGSEFQNIRTSTGSIELYEVQTDAVKLSVTTGELKLTDVTCYGELSLNVSTGKSTLQEVRCASFRSEGSTGSFSADELEVREDLTLSRSTGKVELKNSRAKNLSLTTRTGDVTLDSCAAQEATIQTTTGDVDASFTEPMSFHTETHTGKVTASNTVGKPCYVSTDTGDISLRAPEK